MSVRVRVHSGVLSIRQLCNMACRPRRRVSTITLAEQIAYKKLPNPPPLLHVEMLEQAEDCAWTFVYWVLLANTKQRKVFRHDNERRARVVWKMLVACECESAVARSVSRIYADCLHDMCLTFCVAHVLPLPDFTQRATLCRKIDVVSQL